MIYGRGARRGCDHLPTAIGSEGAQGFRGDGDMLHPTGFQILQMADGGVEQLVIGRGHGGMLAGWRGILKIILPGGQ